MSGSVWVTLAKLVWFQVGLSLSLSLLSCSSLSLCGTGFCQLTKASPDIRANTLIISNSQSHSHIAVRTLTHMPASLTFHRDRLVSRVCGVCVYVCVCVDGAFCQSRSACAQLKMLYWYTVVTWTWLPPLNYAVTARCLSWKRVTITSAPTSAAFPFCPRVVVCYFRCGTVVVVVVSSLLSVDSTEIGYAACVWPQLLVDRRQDGTRRTCPDMTTTAAKTRVVWFSDRWAYRFLKLHKCRAD